MQGKRDNNEDRAVMRTVRMLEDIDKTLTYENQNLAIYKVNTNLEKFTHLIFLEHSGQHR